MAEDNQQQNQQTDWRTPFGADAAPALKDFKEPADFYKSFSTVRTELDTLKKTPPQFDWRKELAGDDTTAQQTLGRFTDPKAFTKSFIEAQTKIRSGELAKPLAADAKPEEVTAWRTANGIPQEPKGYFEQLPDGLVIGKDDQPIFDKYAALWHQHNLSPAAAHAMTKAYYADIAESQKQEALIDKADAQKAISELRNEMGNDYDTNRAILDHWLEGMPGDLKDRFKDATLGDGTRLFNDSSALKYLMQAARQLNPAAHLIPAGGADGKTIQTELDGLKSLMGDQRSKYWKGPESAKLQQRYRDLTTAAQQMKKTG